MTPLPKIMVAPNGARKGKADHPAIPISKDEIVSCAEACFAAGADGLHLHIRDADGGHVLDVDMYRDALAAVTAAVPEMAVQITTEAVGIYAPDVQKRIALEVGADLVSVSIVEMCRDGEAGARAFYEDCAASGIAIQHILYDRTDGELLARVLPDALLHAPSLQLLFVLGRYSEGQLSQPEDLTPFVDWLAEADLRPDWGLCAFGPHETDCLLAAHQAGGKCRIGFENSFFMTDGSIAPDNAARVAELVSRIG